MARTLTTGAEGAFPESRDRARTSAAVQAYQILHVGFVALPALAGVDKFFDVLANWDMYLAPRIAALLPVTAHRFTQTVGIIEMLAALLVALRPRVGAYIIAAWLAGIIMNLLLVPGHYDIALRDFGLALGALALGRLSEEYGR